MFHTILATRSSRFYQTKLFYFYDVETEANRLHLISKVGLLLDFLVPLSFLLVGIVVHTVVP